MGRWRPHDEFRYAPSARHVDDQPRGTGSPAVVKPHVINTSRPYDYYWGGFNTVTGGKNGAAGTDGWYFHRW